MLSTAGLFFVRSGSLEVIITDPQMKAMIDTDQTMPIARRGSSCNQQTRKASDASAQQMRKASDAGSQQPAASANSRFGGKRHARRPRGGVTAGGEGRVSITLRYIA